MHLDLIISTEPIHETKISCPAVALIKVSIRGMG